MASAAVYTWTDFDGENSSSRFPIDDVANEGALRTALEAIVDGQLHKYTVISNEVVVSNNWAAGATAQRETGLRIYLNDSVNGRSGFVTLPCPNFSGLTFNQGQVVLADAGIMAAAVAQIEAHVYSRDGNAVTVTSAKVVGRNT